MNKITLAALLVSFNLIGATFTHRFETVPKTLTNCHEDAAALTKIFISQTGNDSGQVACLTDDGKVAGFELSYSAEKRIPVASTQVWGVLHGGLYKTQKTCNENLTAYVSQFESNTGLSKFISYCKADLASFNPRWSPFILAFGNAKLSYHVSGYYHSSVPYKFDTKAFVESIKSSVEKQGGVFAAAISSSSLGYGTVEIHHYAKEKIPFNLLELSQSAKVELCLQDLRRLVTALNDAGISAVTTYCGQVSVGAYMEVTALFTGESPVTKRPSVERYKTYELCEADRSRLTAYYKSSVDKKILDGFCGNTEGTYKVIFIRTN